MDIPILGQNKNSGNDPKKQLSSEQLAQAIISGLEATKFQILEPRMLNNLKTLVLAMLSSNQGIRTHLQISAAVFGTLALKNGGELTVVIDDTEENLLPRTRTKLEADGVTFTARLLPKEGMAPVEQPLVGEPTPSEPPAPTEQEKPALRVVEGGNESPAA